MVRNRCDNAAAASYIVAVSQDDAVQTVQHLLMSISAALVLVVRPLLNLTATPKVIILSHFD